MTLKTKISNPKDLQKLVNILTSFPEFVDNSGSRLFLKLCGLDKFNSRLNLKSLPHLNIVEIIGVLEEAGEFEDRPGFTALAMLLYYCVDQMPINEESKSVIAKIIIEYRLIFDAAEVELLKSKYQISESFSVRQTSDIRAARLAQNSFKSTKKYSRLDHDTLLGKWDWTDQVSPAVSSIAQISSPKIVHLSIQPTRLLKTYFIPRLLDELQNRRGIWLRETHVPIIAQDLQLEKSSVEIIHSLLFPHNSGYSWANLVEDLVEDEESGCLMFIENDNNEVPESDMEKFANRFASEFDELLMPLLQKTNLTFAIFWVNPHGAPVSIQECVCIPQLERFDPKAITRWFIKQLEEENVSAQDRTRCKAYLTTELERKRGNPSNTYEVLEGVIAKLTQPEPIR